MTGRQTMYIRNVKSYPASMEVSYKVEDPLMYYGVVRLKAEEVTYDSRVLEDTEITYDLDPSDTEITIGDLSEDTKYKLTLYYLDEDGSRVIMDVAYGVTSSGAINLTVDKISKNYITFRADFDKDLELSVPSVEILYENGDPVEDRTVDIQANQLKNGIVTGKILFEDREAVSGMYLTLRLTLKQGKTPLVTERSFKMPNSSGTSLDKDLLEEDRTEIQSTRPELETVIPEKTEPEGPTPAPETEQEEQEAGNGPEDLMDEPETEPEETGSMEAEKDTEPEPGPGMETDDGADLENGEPEEPGPGAEQEDRGTGND